MSAGKPLTPADRAVIAGLLAGLGALPQFPDAKPERPPNPDRIAAAQAKRERKAAIRKRGAL